MTFREKRIMLVRDSLLTAYMKADRAERARIVAKLYVLDEEREENRTEKDAHMKSDTRALIRGPRTA